MPASIVSSRASPQGTGPLGPLNRRDLVGGAIAVVLALAVYARTACRTFYVGDSAELAGAAATFGVPHPPGYPLYTLVTGLLVHAARFFDPAHAANLASGLYAAAAVGLVYLILRRLRVSALAAGFAAAILAVGNTFWSQAVAAEVYSFDALLLTLTIFSVLTAARAPAPQKLALAGAVIGSWLGHRPINLLYVPALALFVSGALSLNGAARSAERFSAWKSWLRPMAMGLGFSLLPWAYLPIASQRHPLIDVGAPDSLSRFFTAVTAAPYHRYLFGNTWSLVLERVGAYVSRLPLELGVGSVLAPLALVALIRSGQRERRLGLACALGAVTSLVIVGLYAIDDFEPCFIPSFVWLTLATGFWSQRLLERFTVRVVGVAALLGAIGLFTNYEENDLSRHRVARNYAEDLLASVTPHSLLIVNGDSVIHGLWYLQAVENRAPDVAVLSLGHFESWYLEGLRRRFPDDDFPTDASDHDLRSLVDHLATKRPIYLAASVSDAPLRQQRDGVVYATFTRGLALEALPTGATLNVRTRGTWNLEFLNRARERLSELPVETDIDTKTLFVQYALAYLRTGDLLRAVHDQAGAKQAYGGVLAFDPDRLEREIQARVRDRSGQTIPLYLWGSQAEKSLHALDKGP